MPKGEESSEECLDILRGSSVFLCFKILEFGSVSLVLTLSHFSLSVAMNAKGGDCWVMASSVVIDGNWSHYCGPQIRIWSYRQLKLSTVFYRHRAWRTRYPVSMSICMLHRIIILSCGSPRQFAMHPCYLVVKSYFIALTDVWVKRSGIMFFCLFSYCGWHNQCSVFTDV